MKHYLFTALNGGISLLISNGIGYYIHSGLVLLKHNKGATGFILLLVTNAIEQKLETPSTNFDIKTMYV